MARPQAAVTMHHGLPTMHVNGQPNAGMTYMTYRPQERYFHDFGQVGVNFVSFLTSPHFKRNRRDLVWTDWDTFDFSETDEIITFILRANPQAMIFPRVYLFTTPWWNEQNRGELMTAIDGRTVKVASVEQKLVVGDSRMAVFDDTAPKDKLLLYSHEIEWV